MKFWFPIFILMLFFPFRACLAENKLELSVLERYGIETKPVKPVKELFAEALLHAEKKEYLEAIMLYSELIENHRNFIPAYSNRALMFYHLGDYEKSLSDFGKLVDIDPKSPDGYNGRGIVYLRQKKFGEAVEEFTRAVRRSPDFAMGYNNRAVAYLRLGNRQKSLEDVKKAQALGFKVPENFLEKLKKE